MMQCAGKLTGNLFHFIHLLLCQNGRETFEEILQSCGNSIDGDVQVVDVLTGIFFQLLEQDIDVCSIAGYSVYALRVQSFFLDEPDTLLQEEGDESPFSLDDVFQRGNGFLLLVLFGIALLFPLFLLLLSFFLLQATLLQLLVLLGFGLVPPSLRRSVSVVLSRPGTVSLTRHEPDLQIKSN